MKHLALLLAAALATAAPLEPRVVVWDEVIVTETITVTRHLAPGEPVPTPAPAPIPAKGSPANVPAPVHQSVPHDPPPAPPAHPTVHPAPAPKPQPTSQLAAPPAPVVAASSSSTAAAASTSSATTPSSDTCPTFAGQSNPLPSATESYCCTVDAPCGTPQAAGAEATYYSMDAGGVQGLGSCGQNLPDSASFVAINQQIMGSLSSGIPMNPLCGKTVVVKNTDTGATATGIVADTCPGCKTGWGIDLSMAVFDQLASEAQGVFPVEWWFTDL